jgi:hypothetical protein
MSRLRIIAWGAALFLLAADAFMQVQAGNAGDKDWLLLAARMWLSGRKIGADIFEVNPPFILWLFAVPVWLSQHVLHIEDYKTLVLMGLGFTMLSVWLGVRLISRHPAFSGDAGKQAGFALLVACTLLFFSTQVYFFDRDHVFFVLTFPYMLRFMPTLARQQLPFGLRLAIALLAAAGFCVKPFTLIVFAVLQLLAIIRERSFAILWSPENLIIYAAGAVYMLCVLQFAPEYVNVVMPMAYETYSGFSRKINGLLFLTFGFITAGLTFADFRPRFVTPYRREVYYFIGVCVAYLLYALAGNGWGYTYNPLLCMLLFLNGWVLIEYGWLKREHARQGLPVKQFTFGRIACATNLAGNAAYMMLYVYTFFFGAACDKNAECRQNETYETYMQDQHIHSFSTMSMSLRRWASLVRSTGAEWDTRFNHLWMMPTLLLDDKAAAVRHRWIKDYLGRAYAEDLNRWKPEAVFVDVNDCIFNYQHPADMVAFLSRTPAFKEAWGKYHYTSTIDDCPKPEDTPKASEGKTQPTCHSIDCRFAVYRRE